MTRRLLAEAFPMVEGLTPDTTATDLIPIAQSLAKHDTAGPILRTIGIHGDMTDEQKDAVDEIVIALADHLKERDSTNWDNLGIAIALARQIVANKIDLDDAPRQQAFVNSRLRVSPPFKDEKPLRVSEVLQFFRNLLNHPELIKPYEELRVQPKEKRHFKDEPAIDIHVFGIVQIWKYGLANRRQRDVHALVMIAVAYGAGRIDRLDESNAIKILRSECLVNDIPDLSD